MASSRLIIQDVSSSIPLKQFQARSQIPLIVAGSKHPLDGFMDSVRHRYAIPSFALLGPHIESRSIDGE
jgi:hypothetical protein